MNIAVQRITTGKWNQNCFIITNRVNSEALIIDPGSEAKRIVKFVKRNKLNVQAILNTHGHYDHVGAVKEIKDEFSVSFYLHSQDKKLLKSANLYTKVFDGDEHISIPMVDYYFDQIETPIKLGKFSIQVLFTPGHTEGGVCFHIEDCLFTGDTLLNRNIGRVDLPGGNISALTNSLKMISELSEDLFIYSGHGESSILGDELRNNIFFMEALKLAP